MKVEIITPDGTRTPHVWKTKSGDGMARCREMYALIGPKCHTVEHITPKGGGHMWMDEDGKYHELDFNDVATEIFWKAGGAPSDFIVGTVILETPARQARTLKARK